MSKFYTEEMRQYLLKNYKGKTAHQIQEEFNCKFNTNKNSRSSITRKYKFR